jgi:dolichol-phosphate mannosyltransferase
MLADHKITMIIPTYNEAENIGSLVQEILSLPLPRLKVMIVDDNSPDRTGDVAESLKLDYPARVDVVHRECKDGLGKAYIAGFRKALAQDVDVIGQMDADFSHSPQKIPEMAKFIDHYDLVIGSRYVKGGSLDENWPFSRKMLSSFGNSYARTILSIPVNDVTGGFRMFKREIIQSIPLENIVSTGYVFMVELLYYAYQSGARIKEVPIYFKDRSSGRSKMSLKIQLEASINIWRLLFNKKQIQRPGGQRQPEIIAVK